MQRSSKAIFEVLAREHLPGLLAFVSACIHNSHDADDIVQRVLIAAWEDIERYDPAREFARWLRGIAQNKIREFFRNIATAHRHVRTLSPTELTAVADEFDHLIVGRAESFPDCVHALRECIEHLPERDRAVVRDAYQAQRSCLSIAERLGESVEAVRKRLQRARAQLRACVTGKLRREVANA